MREAVEAFIRGLPLDARARRVLDQTLLDWAHEADAAPSGLARAWVHLRSFVSCARALVLVTAREVPHVPVLWFAGRLVLFGVLPAFVLVAFLPPRYSVFSVVDSVILLAGWLPLALFYSVAWRPADRRLPVLALALCGAVLVVVFALYVVPAVYWLHIRRQFLTANLGPMPTWSLIGAPSSWALVTVTPPAAMTAALVVLADTVRLLSAWPRRLLLVLTPFLYVLLSSGVWLASEFLTNQWRGLQGLTWTLTLLELRVRGFAPLALVNAAGDALLALAVVWTATRLNRRIMTGEPHGNPLGTP
jgi:hypothetical protein